MNTNLIDISAAISNLVQNGFGNPGPGAETLQTGKSQAFENRFQQEIQRLESRSQSVSGTGVPGVETEKQVSVQQGENAAKAGEKEAPEGKTGLAFLSALEQALRKIAGGDLKSVAMDTQGLDALKKLLLKAGFDPEAVETLISGLKEKAQTKTLTLGDVVGALSDLVIEVDEKANTEAVSLEASALPFITTLLTELGLTPEEISGIMEKADMGSDGLNLEVVIEALQEVSDRFIAQGRDVAVQDTDGSFKALMAQLNLPVETSNGTTVSLNDLIQAFESCKEERRQNAAAKAQGKDAPLMAAAVAAAKSESMTDLVDKFAASLSKPSEKETTPFSYQQIKETFINELMIPSKDKGSSEKSLFAEKHTQEKTDSLFKHVDALLGKTVESQPAVTPGQERKPVFKAFKEDRFKAEGLFQDAPASKSDIETAAAALKAKTTARALPAYVTQQVGRGLVRAVNLGETSLKLQLKPPELGRLSMTIDNQGTGIKVTIVTENQAARDLLASNVNELKAALTTAGISLESFEVDMSSDFRQSMADAGNQAGQFGRRNGGRSGANTSGEAALDEIPGIETGLSADGSYHFVA